jgi:hypothetical protein
MPNTRGASTTPIVDNGKKDNFFLTFFERNG